MAKKRRTKKTNNSKVLTYIAWGLALVAIVLSALVSGYYFGYEDAQDDLVKKETTEKEKRLVLLKKLEEATTATKVYKSVNLRLKEVLKKEKREMTTAQHEFDDKSLAKPPAAPKREPKKISSKPRLAIIIDDISSKSHVRAVKSLSIPLTMSFLPPSKARPNSAKLASKESVYMVHLPLEAKHFNAAEDLTLRIHDSQQKILNRIKTIKVWFPKVKYINNHTGSSFTANETAMNRLIFALNDNGITFIDSRTTAKTKAPKVLKKFGLEYVARDVFLDHKPDKASILLEIKRAIKVAKKHGTAIAIGHPHKNTLLALRESKELLKEVELVYINRLH